MKNLIIRNLSKTYFDPYSGTNVTAVRDVSLEVPEGEFVSIVGPSGCGKTTILNMIAGFIPHSGGEILVGGKPVLQEGLFQLVRPQRGKAIADAALFSRAPGCLLGQLAGDAPSGPGDRDALPFEWTSLHGCHGVVSR